MVRTKADRVPTKAVGSKAPNKIAKSTPVKKAKGSSKGRSYSGGNPTHPRDTPEWQKPITNFLNKNSTEGASTASASASQENEDANEYEETESESE